MQTFCVNADLCVVGKMLGHCASLCLPYYGDHWLAVYNALAGQDADLLRGAGQALVEEATPEVGDIYPQRAICEVEEGTPLRLHLFTPGGVEVTLARPDASLRLAPL